MTPTPQFDTSIPVLTEVVHLTPPDVSGTARSAPIETAAALEAAAIDHWGEHEWELLEHRLAARILRQLQGRIDFVLEQRVKDSMADVLEHAIAGLTREISAGLQQTIEKIVTRAVTQELAHLQALKK